MEEVKAKEALAHINDANEVLDKLEEDMYEKTGDSSSISFLGHCVEQAKVCLEISLGVRFPGDDTTEQEKVHRIIEALIAVGAKCSEQMMYAIIKTGHIICEGTTYTDAIRKEWNDAQAEYLAGDADEYFIQKMREYEIKIENDFYKRSFE